MDYFYLNNERKTCSQIQLTKSVIIDAFGNVNQRCEITDGELDHVIFEQFECQELISKKTLQSCKLFFKVRL